MRTRSLTLRKALAVDFGRKTISATLAAAGILAAACSQGASEGAPPLVVCGTTLWSGAEGAELTDATGRSVTVTAETADNELYLRLADGCSAGARFTIDPAGAAEVVKEAAAGDGRVAAVALDPNLAEFAVHIVHADGTTGLVSVRLGSVPTAGGITATPSATNST